MQTTLIKEASKYLGWVLLFIFLWFNGCSGKEKATTSAKVIVPEVKGQFEAKKPINTPILIKANSPQLKKSTGKDILQVENPINPKLIAENEKLKSDFAKEKDSLKRIIAYNKSVQLNKFSSDFEDNNIIINIDGIVQGEVKEITPGYKIKEKKIEVPVKPKETVFRLLGGLEIGNNINLSNPLFKANLGMQNRKGNIITASYDSNKNIYIGYQFSIFNISR